jgi:hypothetical protein
MTDEIWPAARTDRRRRILRLATGAAVFVGIVARLSVFVWTDPWGPHQPDEHILPLDALALWEGITPREIGWPASTTRIVLSAVAASQWLVSEGRDAWSHRAEPDQALEHVAVWIGKRYVDPTPLYQLGRTTSIVTGILQVIAVVWMLNQWTGPGGIAMGTLGAAMAPVLVAYSQYVLADITGLLFATIALALSAKVTSRRMIVAGILIGLAASSKFHFGIWLLTPLLAIWLSREMSAAEKLRLSFYVVGIAAWIGLMFVPWFLINPLLALKEFVGVVLVKVGHGASLNHVATNAETIYGGFGALTYVGALVGASTLRRRDMPRMVPVLVPVVFGTVALFASAIVFDRYGIVLLPGVAVLAASGWDKAFLSERRSLRTLATLAATACIVFTLASLVRAQQIIAEIDVDSLTRQWVLAHVPRGSRVAVYDEDNAFLPRSNAQLRQCVEHVGTLQAYREKWLVEGVETSIGDEKPMQSMVLNDETYLAYWCRRELQVQRDPGFYVLTYHPGRRFGAVLERDVIEEFRNGGHAITGGVDFLVMNRPIDVGMAPAAVLRTRRGQRVIYRR